jgi:hypothetical protein
VDKIYLADEFAGHERHIIQPAQAPPRVPIGALGKELAQLQDRPQIFSLALAFVVGLAGPVLVLFAVEGGLPSQETVVPWIWLAAAVSIGSLILGCAIASFLPSLLLPARDRAASALHSWIGAREVRRLFGSPGAAVHLPHTPEAAEAWLRAHPDTPQMRPLRFELLLMARRFDEARALIDGFPRDTALAQYRIAEAEALVDDQTSGFADDATLLAAANRVPAGDDRAEAMASLAVFQARRLVGRGDWRAPLVAARPQIPGSNWSILVRDLGSPVFNYIWPRVVLPVGALIIAIAVAITVMAAA